jgi:hypothetical protein
MIHRKEVLAVLIIVVGVAAFLVYTAAHAIGQILAFNDSGQSTAQVVDMSGWQTYTNSQYGFSVNYPPSWQASFDASNDSVVTITTLAPANGTSSYGLTILIENNTSSLSSGEYGHSWLATDAAQDASDSVHGPAPQVAPKFSRSFLLSVDSYQAYELYDVFAYDESDEDIYVAHGTTTLDFFFPMAEHNPNFYDPVENNAVAHQIVNTLTFSD